MAKTDLKKELAELYKASAKKPALVEVPALQYLMVDGVGDPNGNAAFQQAIEALYGLAYTAKFTLKFTSAEDDFVVMPLEGLWWSEAGDELDRVPRDQWRWTLMVVQPPQVTKTLLKQAGAQLAEKKNPPALPLVRLERLREGKCAQILHVGPYDAERPSIERLHEFIAAEGFSPQGKHHEIYMSDPRRVPPERLKTIIRQPVVRA